MNVRNLKIAINHYNCPIVTSYAENIKNNIDELDNPNIRFHNPFLALTNEETVTKRLIEEFSDIPASEVQNAAHLAWVEMAHCREDIRRKGEETLDYLGKNRSSWNCTRRTSVPY